MWDGGRARERERARVTMPVRFRVPVVVRVAEGVAVDGVLVPVTSGAGFAVARSGVG